MASATVGTPYSLTISGSGGAAPYSYGISSGALPDGLGLDPTTGAIVGTPTTSGVYHFDVTLTDASNGAVTAAYVLAVRQIGASLGVDPPSGALSGGRWASPTASLSAPRAAAAITPMRCQAICLLA
ncbi:Ig domain-containing protein (plasmid) [Devosia sp. A8/3-2]|nr:Ig domain-containing protein [Devosia sp. A8/3-2]